MTTDCVFMQRLYRTILFIRDYVVFVTFSLQRADCFSFWCWFEYSSVCLCSWRWFLCYCFLFRMLHT